MNKNSEITRVICCQGTIQFALAMNAMSLREKVFNKQGGVIYKNYLIVHDLFAPNKQDGDFYETIKTIATPVLQWNKITYLDPPTMNQLIDLGTRLGIERVTFEFKSLIDVGKVDELYISRNWQSGSELLITVFSKAFKICYGDSVGLYFPESYFSNRNFFMQLKNSSFGKALKSLVNGFVLAIKFPNRKPIYSLIENNEFDYGYFTFPKISGRSPSFPYEKISIRSLKDTFIRLSGTIHLPIINQINWTSEGIAILLTSNFSEAQRTTLENELKLYKEFIKSFHTIPIRTILIKPHPRDSIQKLDLLEKEFSAEGYEVKLLNEKCYFFTPFEFFLLQLEEANPGLISKLNIFATSSSCLSIWLLFNKRSFIGFGEKLVQKYFNKSQIDARIEHERDLNKSMETYRPFI